MTQSPSQCGRRLSVSQRIACRQFAQERKNGQTRLSVAQFAHHLGVARSTVYWWATREDVKPKPPGPPPGTLRKPLPEGAQEQAKQWRDEGFSLARLTGALQDNYPEAAITRHQVVTHAKQQQWPRLYPPPPVRETRPFHDQPLGFLHLDLIIGPRRGDPVILTGRERHSRWCDAIPLPSKHGVEVVKGLQTFLAACPMRITVILTDCGTEFGSVFDAYLATQGIQHRKTAPRTPQTNGFIERFNALLKQVGPLSDPQWWRYQGKERWTEKDRWEAERRRTRGEPPAPDKRLPRMTASLHRWCSWMNLVHPDSQLRGQSPLSWCAKHPEHSVEPILQGILDMWAAHPALNVRDGRRWSYKIPPTWTLPCVRLSGSS